MDENAPAWVPPRPPPKAIYVVDTKNTKKELMRCARCPNGHKREAPNILIPAVRMIDSSAVPPIGGSIFTAAGITSPCLRASVVVLACGHAAERSFLRASGI